MFVPTTGLQVASHDAWLAEMRKEPSPEIGRVAKARAEGRLAKGARSRLAGVLTRLRSRRWLEVPAAQDLPAQAREAGFKA